MKGRFSEELKWWLKGLRQLFFTRDCAVCGKELEAGEAFVCPDCLGDIPLTRFWSYSENAAMERLGSLCHVYNVASLFFYRHGGGYTNIVTSFKYGRRELLGLWAARLLGDYMAAGGLYHDVQAVVPVPLHWRKRWRRGFNQAEVIARGVAEPLGRIPVAARLLRRRRYTSTQTRKSSSERHSNVSGAFAVRPKEAEKLRAAGVRHILIVDDVLTTGSTLAECIRLLEPWFTVSAATLGFVE